MKTALESFRSDLFSKIIATVTRDRPFQRWLSRPLERTTGDDMKLLRESWDTAIVRDYFLPAPALVKKGGKRKGGHGGWEKKRRKKNYGKRGNGSRRKVDESPAPTPAE